MRQVKPEGPRIYRDKLYQDGAVCIIVGSAPWYAWLAAEEAREFVFRDEAGGWHRARREWRRARAYWYVACRVGGQVRRFYLGAATAVDTERLAAIATAIAVARAAAVAGEKGLLLHNTSGLRSTESAVPGRESTAGSSRRSYTLPG